MSLRCATKELATVRRSQHFEDSGPVPLSLQFEDEARPRNQIIQQKNPPNQQVGGVLFCPFHTHINKINNLHPQVQIRCPEPRNQLRNVAGARKGGSRRATEGSGEDLDLGAKGRMKRLPDYRKNVGKGGSRA